MLRTIFFVLALGFLPQVNLFASHGTTGNANYLGELHGMGLFDEVALTEGNDWYVMHLRAGQPVQLSVSRGDVGDLLPNVSIFDGIALPGGTPADAGLSEVFFTPLTNSNSNSVSVSGGFTPQVSGEYTLIVTTWLGQTGTYDLSYSGFEAEAIPEPGAAACCGLVALFTLTRRCRRF